MMRTASLGAVLAAAVIVAACGSTSPSNPSTVATSIQGSWTGNLQSDNYDPRAIDASFTQAGSSVNGNWTNQSSDWNGTISGTISGTAFSGSATISAPNFTGVGNRCTGNASVSGPVASGATTLRWTSSGFTGSCSGLPTNLVFNLQRK